MINRGQFLKDLCRELVADYINIRKKQTRGIPIYLQGRWAKLKSIDEVQKEEPSTRTTNNRKKCFP